MMKAMRGMMIMLLMGSFMLMAVPCFAEERIVKSFDSFDFDNPRNVYHPDLKCEDCCYKLSNNIDFFLSKGWQIVSKRPLRAKCEAAEHVSCTCNGFEYVIQK